MTAKSLRWMKHELADANCHSLCMVKLAKDLQNVIFPSTNGDDGM